MAMMERDLISPPLSRSHSRASVTSEVARDRETFITQLIIMGINPDAARLAAAKVEYRSVEAALDYIFGRGELDRLLNHEYVDGPGNLCYLCQEPAD